MARRNQFNQTLRCPWIQPETACKGSSGVGWMIRPSLSKGLHLDWLAQALSKQTSNKSSHHAGRLLFC
jgi:hypothetical protein